MIQPSEKFEVSQISLTGTRAIVLIGLLIEAPRTMEEIRNTFIELNLMEPEHSDDILRIDMNTIKAIGCEISRADMKTGKYTLTKHPFRLNLNKGDIVVLKKAYKKIKASKDINLILKYDKFFKKLAGYVNDSEIQEELLGISALKRYSLEKIYELVEACEKNQILKVYYMNPSYKYVRENNIYAQKLVFQNDQIYLYGFDIKKNRNTILNFKRIKEIISKISGSENIGVKTTDVKFYLKSFGVIDIEENEKIIETLEDGYIIEGKYYNEFLAVQRILSFGSKCTVLEPEDFKKIIIKKLKKMRKIYDDKSIN